MVKKKPLELLFSAMHHGKYDYRDFIEGNIVSRVTRKDYTDPHTRKHRITWVPDKMLKVYHAFLNLFLFDYLRINEDVVYSYRKGVNVVTAVSRHAQNRHFFQADLQNFFPSVTAGLARRVIVENGEYSPILDLHIHLDRIIELITIEDALPLGYSTSPVISNAVLKPFDDILQEYCVKRRLTYTRYSDDIIISAQEKDELLGIDDIVTDLLSEAGLAGLALRPDKTKLTSVGNRIKLLGVMILPNGSIAVDTRLRNYVETLLHLYGRDKSSFRDFIEMDVSDGAIKLSGYLNYIRTIDPVYLDKLRKKYGVTLIDSLVHYSKR